MKKYRKHALANLIFCTNILYGTFLYGQSLNNYKLITSEGAVNIVDSYIEESTGDTYLIGTMSETLTFSGWGENRTLNDSPTTRDFFYAKASSSDLQHLYRIAVQGTEAYISQVAVSSDFVYILGSFAGSISIYDEENNLLLDEFLSPVTDSKGNTDAFLIKIDKATGALKRKYAIGGTGRDFGQRMVVINDDIVISGRFNGNVNFGLTFLDDVQRESDGNDLFVVKYDSEDFYLNFTQIGGDENQDEVWAMASGENDDIFIAGMFNRYVEIIPPNVNVLNTNNTKQFFVAKLNMSLTPQWLKLLESDSTTTEIKDLAYDEFNQQLFILGRIEGNPRYDDVSLTTPSPNDDILLLKINTSTGLLNKAHIFGGNSYEDGKQIVLDNLGNYFITGTFNNSLAISSNNLTKTVNGSGNSTFLAVFNRNDDILYINSFTSENAVFASRELSLSEDLHLSLSIPLVYNDDVDIRLSGEQIIENNSGDYDSYIGNYAFHSVPIINGGSIDSEDSPSDRFYTYEISGVNLGSEEDLSARLIDENGNIIEIPSDQLFVDLEDLRISIPEEIVAGLRYRPEIDKQEYKDIYRFEEFNISPNVHPFESEVTVVAGDNLIIPGRYFGNQISVVSVALVTEESGSEIEVPAVVSAVTPSSITISIPQTYPGLYQVRVTVNGATTDGDDLTVRPQITGVVPATNIPAGDMTINGGTFIDNKHTQELLEVRLIEEGNNADTISITEFIAVAAGKIDLQLPDDLAKSSYQVEVDVNGFVTNQQLITIEDNAPLFDTLQPVSGRPGDEVTISGLNLEATTVQVKINEVEATVNSSNATEIKATVPQLDEGTYQVIVSLDGTEYPLTDQFTVAPPVVGEIEISSIDKQIALVTDKVTLSGLNLNLAASVLLGEAEAAFEKINDNTLELTIPDVFPGDYQIEVNGALGEEPAFYPVKIAHSISGLSETEVYSSEELTISGNNFRSAASPPDIQVLLDDVAVEGITVNEAGTAITFTLVVTEEMAGEEYEVKVVVNGISVTALEKITITSDSTDPEVSFVQNSWDGEGFSVAVQAADPETDIEKVEVAYAGIMDEAYGAFQELTLTEDQYPFSTTEGDELGIKYQFRVTNGANRMVTVPGLIYRSYDLDLRNDDVANWNFVAEPEQQNYQLVAIPFEAQPVAEALGSINYDPKTWRLYRRNPAKTTENGYEEYNAGFSQFKAGEGYWLIAKNGILDHLQGDVAQPNEDGNILIPVSQGWNLIGNPYPFAIDWNTVVSVNPDMFSDQERLSKYKGDPQNDYDKDDTELLAYEGAFVDMQTSGNLIIPFSAKSTGTTIRKSSKHEKEKIASLEASDWQISLSVFVSEGIQQHLRLGMHQEAKFDRDYFDADVFPSFFGTSAAHFNRDNTFLETDIIPPGTFAEWSIEFTDQIGNEGVVLFWDHQKWKSHQYQLWLYNEQTQQVIDMQSTQSYHLYSGDARHPLKVLYGRPEDLLAYVLPSELHISKAFPNPASDHIHLTLMVPYHEATAVTWQLLDMTGRMVRNGALSLQTGIHQASFEVTEKPGLYFLKVISSEGATLSHQKILLK